jgi:hypothetical protein
MHSTCPTPYQPCETSGSHGSECKDNSLLGYSTVYEWEVYVDTYFGIVTTSEFCSTSTTSTGSSVPTSRRTRISWC